jgi:two-component system OmpR family sensor kinase
MSLRARLIAGLLAVAAAGLLTLGAIVYAEQRSFLVQRVDQQARSAIHPVAYALDDREIMGPAPAAGQDGTRETGLEKPRHNRPPMMNFNLPPGTYGESRDAGGKVLEHGGDAVPIDRPADVRAGDRAR